MNFLTLRVTQEPRSRPGAELAWLVQRRAGTRGSSRCDDAFVGNARAQNTRYAHQDRTGCYPSRDRRFASRGQASASMATSA